MKTFEQLRDLAWQRRAPLKYDPVSLDEIAETEFKAGADWCLDEITVAQLVPSVAFEELTKERDSLRKEVEALREGIDQFVLLGECGAIEDSDKCFENGKHATDYLERANAIRDEREKR